MMLAKRKNAALATLAWLMSTGGATALEFSKHPTRDTDKVNAILVSGKIEKDDAFAFQAYVTKLAPKPDIEVHLDSSGGLVSESLELGRIFNKLKIRTHVIGDKARCNSACTNLFMAGRDRETDRPYRVKGQANNVGWHNFYPIIDEKKMYKKGDMLRTEANAQRTIMQIAEFLLDVDADVSVISLGLRQEQIYNMSNTEALQYGIHILNPKTAELIRYEPYLERLRAARTR